MKWKARNRSLPDLGTPDEVRKRPEIALKPIKDIPNFERPREKLAAKGPEALSDSELLAILLGSGVKGKDVFQVAHAILCISLNGANEVIGNRVVTVGLLNTNQVHPREVFVDAISDRAAAIIVAHNHPSGLLKPSPDDMAITRQLVEAGKILGIPVLDHIIITKKGHLSLKEKGLM